MNKHKLWIALAALLVTLSTFSQEICMTSPVPITLEARAHFYHSVREAFSKAVPGLVFQGGTDTAPLTAPAYTWKIKRKRPAFGRLPELKRPRWKRERLSIRAAVDTHRFCLDVVASIYNRRGKKWYDITMAPGQVDDIMAPAMLKNLEGQRAWIMGPLLTPTGERALPPLTRVIIAGARLSVRNLKMLIVDLQPEGKPNTIPVTVPYIGDVSRIDHAITALQRHLTWSDPKKGVDPRYSFFWAYAQHGELMDGMHARQVQVALGQPDQVVRSGPDTEIWTYGAGKDARTLTIRHQELVLPD